MNGEIKRWMKKLLLAGICLLLAGNASALNAILNTDGSTWSNSVWTGVSTYPGSADTAFIRGSRTVTVDSDVGSVRAFYIGDAVSYDGGTGAVNIVSGGSLTSLTTSTTARSALGRYNTDGAVGHMNISGGTLNMGNAGETILYVGVDTPSANVTGNLTISGGTFNGRLLVGSNESGDFGDNVIVDGASATIGTASTVGNALEVRASAKLTFKFDATGISTMHYGTSGSGGIVSFATGSQIVVDGAAYTGGDATFNLITAGQLGTENCLISLINLPAGTTYSWDQTADILSVSIVGNLPPQNTVLNSDGVTWTNADWTQVSGYPRPVDTAFIRNGYEVTVDSDVGSVYAFHVGDTSASGTVNIVDGGSLTSTTASDVLRSDLGRGTKDGSVGYMNISGGTLNMGSSGEYILNIGVDTATARSTGVLSITDGVVNGRLLVGSNEAGDSGDQVIISGSSATVGTVSITGNALEVRASGTLEFKFDATGISTMDYGISGSGGYATFVAGSQILIDGAAYAGDAATFTLITAGVLGAENATVILTNFAAGTTYDWDQTADVLSVSPSGSSILITPQSLYADWLTNYPGLGTETNLTDNPDGDELNNLYEYASGGNPDDVEDVGIESTYQTVVSGGTNYIEYTYAIRNDADIRGLGYHLETTIDLVEPAWTNDNYTVVGTNGLNEAFSMVINRMSTGEENTQFLRLKMQMQ